MALAVGVHSDAGFEASEDVWCCYKSHSSQLREVNLGRVGKCPVPSAPVSRGHYATLVDCGFVALAPAQLQQTTAFWGTTRVLTSALT